jgi:hypothetical protein
MEYTDVSMALYTSEIARRDAMIYTLEGMVKEICDRWITGKLNLDDYEYMSTIAASPDNDPVKLHEVIKAALSFREADKLEDGHDNPTPNLS